MTYNLRPMTHDPQGTIQTRHLGPSTTRTPATCTLCWPPRPWAACQVITHTIYPPSQHTLSIHVADIP